MERKIKMNSLKLYFWFYFVLYSANAIYGTFAPVYFRQLGYGSSDIGLLLSIGPFIAVLAQPAWGSLADKARSKNAVLAALLAGSGLSMLLFPLSSALPWLIVAVGLFTLFQSSTGAITDAITLEALGREASRFGRIRIGGTLGFAAMSVGFGIYAEKVRLEGMFTAYAAVMGATLLLLLLYPRVRGHQFGGRKLNFLHLLRNRRLMLYMGLCFAIHMTLGYYYAFFPLYFTEIGAGKDLLGWSMVVSALGELPFLLLSALILKRFSVSAILLAAGGVSALRWLLYAEIGSIYGALAVQALHGLTFIVVAVTMSVYINKEVAPELRASGQTLNALLNAGAARIIGTYAGGYAVEASSLQDVFRYAGLLLLAALALFALAIRLLEKRGLPGASRAG
ncbi:putative 3-phenylpropionic acid transporter [Paenibacillus pasadenensis]|uniref:Putative 3-phenylpropionic acid transporter n=2 Tax=Paenibacillus TaxID=44249 RepID=A0A2N5N6H1_9BACL|nr:putative 3-phenylpropionic acid transporter [Paenibacillus pasadenensis]